MCLHLLYPEGPKASQTGQILVFNSLFFSYLICYQSLDSPSLTAPIFFRQVTQTVRLD